MTNGVMEARMVHALAYLDNNNKEKDKNTIVTIRQLIKMMGNRHITKKELLEILESVINNDKGATFLIISCDKTKENILCVLTKRAKKIIKDNFNYTLKDLKEYVQLNSTYSQDLFEFAFSYRGTKSVFMSIEDFKKRFRIPDFHNFNIIDVSILKHFIKELESKTSFRIKIEKEKNGLKFYFTEERK